MRHCSPIQRRKDQHLDACLNKDVSSEVTNGFERYRLIPDAAPDADFASIDCSQQFLGKTIHGPLLISSMTGGTAQGELINRNLCLAAEATGLPIGLGSLRVFIEASGLAGLAAIRRDAPTVPVLANIGAVQLNDRYSIDDINAIVDAIEADGLIFHFNPLQEIIQPDGDTNFTNLLKKISVLRTKIRVPVIAKEVGFGFSVATVHRLIDAGFDWVDVAGAGGTSWAKVEMYARGETPARSLYGVFNDFGLPTAVCLERIHAAFPTLPLIASGGIRNGVEMRKAEFLGARLSGMALPLLRPALQDADAVIRVLNDMLTQYRAACFVSAGIEKISES